MTFNAYAIIWIGVNQIKYQTSVTHSRAMILFLAFLLLVTFSSATQQTRRASRQKAEGSGGSQNPDRQPSLAQRLFKTLSLMEKREARRDRKIYKEVMDQMMHIRRELMDIRDGAKEHLNITKMSDEGKQREGSDGQREPMEADILWEDEQPGDKWVIDCI